MKQEATRTTLQLKGMRRYFWVAALVIGAAAVVAVALISSNREVATQPAVHVPNMQNVPPPDTKMGVEVEERP